MKKLTPFPVADKILILPEIPEVKKGGAFMPDTSKEEKKKPSQGKIVATGSEYKGQLKKGQIVLYDKFGPEYFTIENIEYAATIEDNIFVVLK